ncbi:MAG: DNA-3-methyladenine glycosylase 2 family protein [Myxococcota bacterium]
MRLTVPIEGPLDLVRTVTGSAQWGGCSWIQREGDAVWYATRAPDGPATVRLAAEAGRLVAEAWGPGADWLLSGAAALAGLHDDPSRLRTDHPVVRRLQKERHGVRLSNTGQVYPTLIAAILAQKVTGLESRAQLRRIAWAWGERAPGPRDDLWILPPPARLAETPYYAVHPLGVERKRAIIVIEAARRIRRLEEAVRMPFPEASARLQALRGIGPWTAGVVLAEALGDPDAVPIGDYHLPNTVAWHLAGEPRRRRRPHAGHSPRPVRRSARPGRPAAEDGRSAPKQARAPSRATSGGCSERGVHVARAVAGAERVDPAADAVGVERVARAVRLASDT